MDKERRKYLRLKEKMGYEGKGRDWFDFECEDHNDVHMEIGNWNESKRSQKPKSVWLCDCGLRLIVDFLYI